MKTRRGQHVVPSNGKWCVCRAGSSRASGIYDTQDEAIEHAREIAHNQKADLYIHGLDGRICARIRFIPARENRSNQ